MGLVGSKDDRGRNVLAALPQGFLDARGKELRDTLDACLERNMWFFTIGGLVVAVPLCFKYKTERPFYAAAVTCPVADMYYGTLRCKDENEAFREYYAQLHEQFNQRVQQPAWKREAQEQQQQQQWERPEHEPRWQPPSPEEERLRQQQSSGWSWWRR